MLMKLALYDSKKTKDNIVECCTKFYAHHIPILKNKFGILTEDCDVAFGREDVTHASDLNVKTFVNIYKCVQNRESKKISLFGKKNITPYSGELLDNLFFKNVISFCEENNIELEYLRYISDFVSEDTVTDIDEMKNIFNQMENFRILKLSLNLQDKSLIFNKNGYVDLGLEYNFYKENEDKILDMIKAGFKD